MVGSGDCEIEQKLKQEIINKKLQNHIMLSGFTLDVKSMYMQASLFISTSEYEGYPTTFTESQSMGIPAVIYELPYLTIVDNNPGIISVGQNDVRSMANEIISLLTDRAKLDSAGLFAYNKVQELSKFSFEKKWSDIFYSLEHEREPTKRDKNLEIMWDTLLNDYECGVSKNNVKINELEKKIKSLPPTNQNNSKSSDVNDCSKMSNNGRNLSGEKHFYELVEKQLYNDAYQYAKSLSSSDYYMGYCLYLGIGVPPEPDKGRNLMEKCVNDRSQLKIRPYQN